MTSGTNPVADYAQTNFTVDTGTAYKTKIDKNSIVAQRIVGCFAPRQTTVAAMTVTIDAGHVFAGTTLTEVAPQVTGTIAAPLGNPRIDRVVVDRMTGALSVATGTPAATPAPPAIPAGKSPVCQVLLQTTSTTITNSMITDERDSSGLGRGAAGEEGIGQWLKDDGAGNLTVNANATLRDNGSGALTTGLTTEAAIASASTTNLGTMASNIGVITGGTAIASFGSSASTANPFYVLRTAGTPLLTSGANMILPGGANYTCAAGDVLLAKYEGSGAWRVTIQPASGQAVVSPSHSLTPGNTLTLNPYAVGAHVNAAHGLASTPQMCIASLVCLTAEGGYVAGNTVMLNGSCLGIYVTDTVYTISSDATSVYLNTTPSTPVQISRKDTSANFDITPANWKVVVTPLLFA